MQRPIRILLAASGLIMLAGQAQALEEKARNTSGSGDTGCVTRYSYGQEYTAYGAEDRQSLVDTLDKWGKKGWRLHTAHFEEGSISDFFVYMIFEKAETVCE